MKESEIYNAAGGLLAKSTAALELVAIPWCQARDFRGVLVGCRHVFHCFASGFILAFGRVAVGRH